MALSCDSAVFSDQLSVKNPSTNVKKRIVGVSICCLSSRNWTTNARIRIQSAMQVDLQDAEISRSSREELLGVDAVAEGELREKGFLGLRKTKLVCTIGPACCSLEDLEKLALGGMNVARLNMCHNTREWHREVIRKIKKLNDEKGFSVSLMIDTEGSQIHVVDHGAPSSVKAEVKFRNY